MSKGEYSVGHALELWVKAVPPSDMGQVPA
jgi:hypothetical protein